MGKKTGKNPTDRGKLGVKRSVVTDSRGVPLGIALAGANVHDAKLLRDTLRSIPVPRPKSAGRSKQHLCLDKGYYGQVVVCTVYFKPIAGYIPDRPVIKYLQSARNIEIAFAPLAGTRFLVPFRMVVPTPLGTAMLEATHFVTQANPHSPKTQ